MNTFLWTLQIFLVIVCLYSGLNKSIYSEHKLVYEKKQTGVEGLPHPLIKFIGIAQLFCAFGLILPWYLNIVPVLTPIAAFGFAIDITMASGIHIHRKEYLTAAATLTIALISYSVAFGRILMLFN